jgi:hypothetical protein
MVLKCINVLNEFWGEGKDCWKAAGYKLTAAAGSGRVVRS